MTEYAEKLAVIEQMIRIEWKDSVKRTWERQLRNQEQVEGILNDLRKVHGEDAYQRIRGMRTELVQQNSSMFLRSSVVVRLRSDIEHEYSPASNDLRDEVENIRAR